MKIETSSENESSNTVTPTAAEKRLSHKATQLKSKKSRKRKLKQQSESSESSIESLIRPPSTDRPRFLLSPADYSQINLHYGMNPSVFLKLSRWLLSTASKPCDFADALHFPWTSLILASFVCILWLKQYIFKVEIPLPLFVRIDFHIYRIFGYISNNLPNHELCVLKESPHLV